MRAPESGPEVHMSNSCVTVPVLLPVVSATSLTAAQVGPVPNLLAWA